MRNRVRAPVGPVVRGNQESRSHPVDQLLQPVGLLLAFPLGEAGLHVDEVVDLPRKGLELRVRLVEVARVVDGDGGCEIGDQIAAGREVGSSVLAALHDFDRDAFEVAWAAGRELAVSADETARDAGIEDLHAVSWDALRDRQVTFEGRVSIDLCNGLGRVDAPGTHIEPPKPVSPAEPVQGGGMTVIEVLVSDEDVVVDRVRGGQRLVEEIGIERDVHAREARFEAAATGPAELHDGTAPRTGDRARHRE